MSNRPSTSRPRGVCKYYRPSTGTGCLHGDLCRFLHGDGETLSLSRGNARSTHVSSEAELKPRRVVVVSRHHLLRARSTSQTILCRRRKPLPTFRLLSSRTLVSRKSQRIYGPRGRRCGFSRVCFLSCRSSCRQYAKWNLCSNGFNLVSA